MKARFKVSAILSSLLFAFASTMTGVAQQADVSAAPAAQKVSPAEQALINKMSTVVAAAKKSGKLDMKKASEILKQAGATPVSSEVMGILVGMLAEVAPEEAPQIAAAAAKSYGPNVTKGQIIAIVEAAIKKMSHPFSAVGPVCDAVEKAIAGTPAASEMADVATGVAAQTPDNPLGAVTTQTTGLVTPGDRAGEGALVKPGGLPIGTLPEAPDAGEVAPDVSSPVGRY